MSRDRVERLIFIVDKHNTVLLPIPHSIVPWRSTVSPLLSHTDHNNCLFILIRHVIQTIRCSNHLNTLENIYFLANKSDFEKAKQ